ncbi:MAG TPA: cytochrome c [Stellaceae bacterium]|jgi:mono/diheme cytochrome c family protein
MFDATIVSSSQRRVMNNKHKAVTSTSHVHVMLCLRRYGLVDAYGLIEGMSCFEELRISGLRSRKTVTSALLAAFVLLTGCATRRIVANGFSSADPGAAARGEYLVAAANCAGCHTDSDHHGARFAGGKAIESPFGAYYSRNITSDPANGIGAWSDVDFLTALRTGVSPSGAHYFAAFPFTAFSLMTDRDILDIKAYLATMPPSATVDRAPDAPFPFDLRAAMVPWRALFFREGPFLPIEGQGVVWNRGAYLASAVIHCAECHTPRNFLGGLKSGRGFSGATLYGPGDVHAPNITSDRRDGIGTWSLADVEALLDTGITPTGDFVSGPMAEVVGGTSKLTVADRHAIAVFVKSLPPMPSDTHDRPTGG